MDEPDRDLWETFSTTWPDMSMVNALIHERAPDRVIHEAMCAAREGRVPDIDPERIHQYPKRRTRWVLSSFSTGGIVVRRQDEPGD